MDPVQSGGPWTPGPCFVLTHFVDMSIFTPNTRQVLPKLQSIIEFLSLNLSDLCNKISLCNTIDNSAAKNSIKKGRLYKEKENEFVMFMLRRVNKMQPSQSGTGIFLIFDSSSFFIETRAFKVNHSNEKRRCITLLDDKGASFHLDRKKVIFSHAYRRSSRSLHGVTTHVKPPGFKQLN